MKNLFKVKAIRRIAGIIAIVAIIGFAGCSIGYNPENNNNNNNNNGGEKLDPNRLLGTWVSDSDSSKDITFSDLTSASNEYYITYIENLTHSSGYYTWKKKPVSCSSTRYMIGDTIGYYIKVEFQGEKLKISTYPDSDTVLIQKLIGLYTKQ